MKLVEVLLQIPINTLNTPNPELFKVVKKLRYKAPFSFKVKSYYKIDKTLYSPFIINFMSYFFHLKKQPYPLYLSRIIERFDSIWYYPSDYKSSVPMSDFQLYILKNNTLDLLLISLDKLHSDSCARYKEII